LLLTFVHNKIQREHGKPVDALAAARGRRLEAGTTGRSPPLLLRSRRTPQQCFRFDAARFASASRYDAAANLIKTHKHIGDFKEP
jgi:hypothetical protein